MCQGSYENQGAFREDFTEDFTEDFMLDAPDFMLDVAEDYTL